MPKARLQRCNGPSCFWQPGSFPRGCTTQVLLCFKKYICSVDGVKSNNIHAVKGSFGLSLDIKDSRKLHKGIRNGVRLPKGKREMLRSREIWIQLTIIERILIYIVLIVAIFEKRIICISCTIASHLLRLLSPSSKECCLSRTLFSARNSCALNVEMLVANKDVSIAGKSACSSLSGCSWAANGMSSCG